MLYSLILCPPNLCLHPVGIDCERENEHAERIFISEGTQTGSLAGSPNRPQQALSWRSEAVRLNSLEEPEWASRMDLILYASRPARLLA
jgi:hypothetical protein